MSKGWRGGSTRAYRKVRAAILLNNQATNAGQCTVQVPDVCTGRADCVHHTKGRAVTGDDPRYMVAACTACNLHIGQPIIDPRPSPRTEW